MAASTLSIAAFESLPVDHKLRLFLKPHSWGSVKINLGAAANLFAKNMIVHRSSPFADEAFLGPDGSDGKLWQMIPALRYTGFETTFKRYKDAKRGNSKSPDVPFFDDGILLHRAINSYTKSFVEHIYGEGDQKKCDAGLKGDPAAVDFARNFFEQGEATPSFWPARDLSMPGRHGLVTEEEFKNSFSSCERFSKFLGEVIFMVTGWHRHVGTVQDFVRDTRFVALSWHEGEQDARPKHSVLMNMLAATTNANYPRLNQSLADIYERAPSKETSIFNGLYNSMKQVQDEVTKRNEERVQNEHLAFHQMEPQYVEWGVEV